MKPLTQWLCFRLETGAKTIGSVGSGLVLLFLLYTYTDHCHRSIFDIIDRLGGAPMGYTKEEIASAIIISLRVGAVFELVVDLLLLYGAVSRQTCPLWPYLIVRVLSALYYLTHMFTIPFFIINLAIEVYNFLAVLSYRQELLDSKRQTSYGPGYMA